MPGLAAIAALAAAATLSLAAGPLAAQDGIGRAAGDAGTVAPASDAGIDAQEPGAPRATMTCEHAAVPGRVHCEVEARVDAGDAISWGDVVLERVPAFAAALRGRVGPHDAVVREPGLWRWPFALVAHDKGEGQVEGRVRVVLCREKTCVPRDVAVVGMVQVGP